jgi:hypothetical protein
MKWRLVSWPRPNFQIFIFLRYSLIVICSIPKIYHWKRLNVHLALGLWSYKIINLLNCMGATDSERMSCYLGVYAKEAGSLTLWAFLGTKLRHLTTSRQVTLINKTDFSFKTGLCYFSEIQNPKDNFTMSESFSFASMSAKTDSTEKESHSLFRWFSWVTILMDFTHVYFSISLLLLFSALLTQS